jgi:hypothetical protein
MDWKTNSNANDTKCQTYSSNDLFIKNCLIVFYNLDARITNGIR